MSMSIAAAVGTTMARKSSEMSLTRTGSVEVRSNRMMATPMFPDFMVLFL
jgi:hypothetical protein